MANDYKQTMNLPDTDFPMRARLPENEPKRLAKWYDMDLYHQVLKANEGHPSYILHDGPPYANGPIHIGHAFNKILKDIVVRYRSQRGYFSPYVPGWDCHGQPIEHMVEEMLGPEKMKTIDQASLRRLCRDWASKYIDIQREGFKRLGVLGDWENPYLTYLPEYEAGIVKVFKLMYEDGVIYRGRKPIHWCYHCHTALAEAEIEYSDETSPSIYVAFDFTAEATEKLQARLNTKLPVAVLIWTTTPWTLPANTAVSLAPKANYVAVERDGRLLILAEDLLGEVSAVADWGEVTPLLQPDGKPYLIKSSEMEGLRYHHPIHEQMTGVVVLGEHVDLSTGTGAVHTAPGHGQDDYLIGELYHLPMLMPVNDDGVFDAGGGPFAGLNVEEANPVIIDWLRQRGQLIAAKSITHSYPHCWRCHNPVIFRATEQWFVSMDGKGLREKALLAISELNWYPEWAANRLRAMVESRPDWCISRQRSWGVPIPVFRCAECGEVVATPETFDAVIELFGREGADAWFTKKPEEYLPAGTHCEHCGSTKLVPEKDILDVWWESGVSHTSVLEARPELSRPADLYLEGSDQHRGWFQSSLLTSVGAYGEAPYKGIMSCGFTVDEQGHKMSKSLGNGIDPAEVTDKYGADVLRLWVGSVDNSQDVSVSEGILERTADAYRRIRNTFRFLLSNLQDFDYRYDTVGADSLLYLDRWALARAEQLLQQVNEAYESYRFHTVYRAVYDYIVTDLSAVYLDALKDRLYSDAASGLERRSAQTVLMNILEVLVRTLAPILSFTCDEVWENYPAGLRTAERPEAVALAGWPELADFTPALEQSEVDELLANFEHVLSAREAVTRALEEARAAKLVNKSQEATVNLKLGEEDYAILAALPVGLLEELFIVAAVRLERLGGDDETDNGFAVTIARAEGEKCPRCWNIRTLGGDPKHPDVCSRCAAVLENLEV